MNRYIQKFYLMICLSMTAFIQAEIIEIKNIKEIYTYLTPDTLIVFDIDNTLIEPNQELGNDQWFYHRITHLQKNGLSSNLALSQALAEWHAVQYLTPVKAVECDTADIIKDLQNKNHTMIGLTTRGLQLWDCTVCQLNKVNINLSLNAPSKKHVYLQNPHRGVLFIDGILFTQATHKGEALKKLCEELKLSVKKVLFINDKATHLAEVEATCQESDIPFIGLRYGYLDEKVKNFRHEIAELQFNHFGRLLSNEEAEKILTP